MFESVREDRLGSFGNGEIEPRRHNDRTRSVLSTEITESTEGVGEWGNKIGIGEEELKGMA